MRRTSKKMSRNTFKQEEVLSYWSKYFPEINVEELDKIIDFMGEIDYKVLSREYNNYNDIGYQR